MTSKALMKFEDFVSERSELLYVELVSSFFSIICNLYFVFRFSAVSTFNPNLRIIMTVFQLFTATIAFLHPVLRFVPESWYSIREGKYVGAVVYYAMQYYIQLCLFIMCSKFAIFGLERRFAVKYRVNYEFQDGRKMKQLLALFIFLLAAFLFIKSAFIFYFDELDNLKERLERAFLVDKFPPVLITLHIFGGCSWIYGLYEFLRLSRHLKQHWYDGRTLSESYQIKQSGAVVKVLKPIVVAFLIMFVSNSFIMFLAIYLYYFQGFNANSPLFVTLMNIEYTGAAMYNLFATSYMLWYFKPVRKLMLQDLARFCLIDVRRSAAITSNAINWEKEREDHFQYLNTNWNQIPATPKRSIRL